MTVALRLVPETPKRTICEAMGVSRSSLKRRLAGPIFPAVAEHAEQRGERHIARRISDAERQAILDLLHSERFVDLAVPQIHAQLLDEGRYLCSVSTMYRLLRANEEVKERRSIARHPEYKKPELLATGPRQVLSWDITKIRGPHKGVWFSLLVMIDIFSRLVVGWQVVRRANAAIAENFIRVALRAEGIAPGDAALHSDRGTEMTSQLVCDLLDALGVTRSLSRPQVSDDNPYSESQFKTLKYHKDFPDRFGSPEDAKVFFRGFFDWYNHEHRHSGIAMLTPAMVHAGAGDAVLDARHRVMLDAYAATPERFINGQPKRAELPKDVWINKPDLENAA
jgi:putative transposase